MCVHARLLHTHRNEANSTTYIQQCVYIRVLYLIFLWNKNSGHHLFKFLMFSCAYSLYSPCKGTRTHTHTQRWKHNVLFYYYFFIFILVSWARPASRGLLFYNIIEKWNIPLLAKLNQANSHTHTHTHTHIHTKFSIKKKPTYSALEKYFKSNSIKIRNF
jgi:hypothetical protein